jgi:hypothetical protein
MYCVQIQLSLRQSAKALWAKRQESIRDLEEFSSRGIPELTSTAIKDIIGSTSIF